ncbi:hypothetical protein OG225_42450 (plasmid) [Nocardia sp. NBC_01377]|uniref:hypothetical protein n=1 Tax=Nocardia sp. NBC_01377 TaxID=2903595 RepID=UPI00324F5652
MLSGGVRTRGGEQVAYLLRCELQDFGDLVDLAAFGVERGRGPGLSSPLLVDRVCGAGAGIGDATFGSGNDLLEVVLGCRDRRDRVEELGLGRVDTT